MTNFAKDPFSSNTEDNLETHIEVEVVRESDDAGMKKFIKAKSKDDDSEHQTYADKASKDTIEWAKQEDVTKGIYTVCRGIRKFRREFLRENPNADSETKLLNEMMLFNASLVFLRDQGYISLLSKKERKAFREKAIKERKDKKKKTS